MKPKKKEKKNMKNDDTMRLDMKVVVLFMIKL